MACGCNGGQKHAHGALLGIPDELLTYHDQDGRVPRSVRESAPDVIDFGDYNVDIGNKGSANFPSTSRAIKRRYQALSIGPDSDLDAIGVRVQGAVRHIDIDNPVLAAFSDSVSIVEIYPRITSGNPPVARLTLYGWPTIPAAFPRRQVRMFDVETDALSTSQVAIRTLPVFGRRRVLVGFQNPDAAIVESVRVAGLLYGSTGAHESPLWPDPDDATVFHSLAVSSQKITVDSEGLDYLKLYAKSASGTPSLKTFARAYDTP